ncbi:uncharacterized protein FSUBG_11 [Fusarium subglutinans]|uniref:C2H2-type domain-containing protein n=1 Tax=Gibberella subglutinans TaxID=42677 RepID=A0A8H5V877_GIBSU|nr:uncharacterized protein FSUBG_11 [Fusarium subglutinans]KAF5614131.1 hypothetical protein FSUBG_11 [Fusarium subglutinans]
MEHRPLPHHSPAIRRFLDETEFDQYYPIVVTKEPDRENSYVDSHKAQLHSVRHNVPRREPSEAIKFPFLCVFHFAGCDQEFSNKSDWKKHVVSQHLKLDRVFWRCNEGDCAHSRDTLAQCKSVQTTCPSSPGQQFTNKHDFQIHLLAHHQSTKPNDEEGDIISLPNTEVKWLVDRSDSSMRMVCGLPQDLGCPMPQCASVRFTGPAAWDQRLNHAAEHFLASPQCMGVFGGEKDAELVQWASCNAVSILEQTPDANPQQHDCNKSVADSGYSSRPDMPRRLDMSEHGDSSPAVPRKMQLWKSDATFSDRSTEELYSDADLVGIGAQFQDYEDRMTLIDKEINFSVCKSSEEVSSKHESTGDHHTLNTSQDSDSGGESDETPDRNPETTALMQWSRGWLRQWLAPLTQERPNGNEGHRNTASQSQNSTSTSSSSSKTQKKKGAPRPHRPPKRKRSNDDEDEGNGESSKSQCIDGDSAVRMLACPFFKRNPRKYGQPKWKSCAHPGYPNMHRVKEHMFRKHSLPEYQCRRCRVDLETSEALEAHSQQLQACTPCISNQDGLSQDQVKRMRSKKGAGKNKSDQDKWNDVYSIVFPHDQQTPSPCMSAPPSHRFSTNPTDDLDVDDTDQDENAREFNLCHEFRRFLERELPPLVRRRLSTIGCPLPETIKDDIEQYVKGLVPQLQGSFLGEMGFVAGGQLDVASTTNDGDSFVDSTTTIRTSEDSATTLQQDSISEHQTTTLPKGSTSQEAMSMFPISDGSKELTTMPQVGYDIADSTMFLDGTLSAQGMMFPTSQIMPPYFSTTNEDWQAFLQFGYNPNLP